MVKDTEGYSHTQDSIDGLKKEIDRIEKELEKISKISYEWVSSAAKMDIYLNRADKNEEKLDDMFLAVGRVREGLAVQKTKMWVVMILVSMAISGIVSAVIMRIFA